MRAEHNQEQEAIKNELKATKTESIALEHDMKAMEENYYTLQQNYYRLRTVLEQKRTNQLQTKDLFESYEKRLLDEQQRYKVLESNSAQELARWDSTIVVLLNDSPDLINWVRTKQHQIKW